MTAGAALAAVVTLRARMAAKLKRNDSGVADSRSFVMLKPFLPNQLFSAL
jgi:hypothetical protein